MPIITILIWLDKQLFIKIVEKERKYNGFKN